MAKVIEKGPVIARYLDRDIPSYFVDMHGRKYKYIGLAEQHPPHSGKIVLDRLEQNQAVLAPGLLYELVEGGMPSAAGIG